MRGFVYVFSSLVVGASWWIALIAFGVLSQRLPKRWQEGRRHGVVIIFCFLLAGASLLVAAHLLEHTFHITILRRYDE
jgi:ABC-type enterochelin transport system permease subunit